MTRRGVKLLSIAGLIACGVSAAIVPAAQAATSPPTYSSLSFSGSPGDAISGGSVNGTFATPKATVTATGASGVYTVTVIQGPNTVVFTIAPPNGKFTLGATFTATDTDVPGQGQFEITANNHVCPSQTSAVTVSDLGFDTTNTISRIALRFVDHCGTATSPPAVGALYIKEPEIAPIPSTTVYSSPLIPAGSSTTIGGTVGGYSIAPAKPGQYVVTTTVTGLTAGASYEGVVAFNVGGTSLKDVDVCAIAATGAAAGDTCVGSVTVPAGTVTYGNEFLVQQVVTGQPRNTVATGAFLQSKP